MAYIPTKDADLIDWGSNFASVITADPAAYGLLAADALVIQTNFDEFQAAYTLAVNPATRTIVTIAAKDEEKAGFLSLARGYAAIIRANAGVSDEAKAAAGLTIPDPTPTPIPVPTTSPLLAAPLQGQGVILMTITDSATPTLKKKPFGVLGGILYAGVWTGATPPVPGTLTVVGLYTKSDNVITTASFASPGDKFRFQAQWYNRKGQLGPLGPATDLIILG